MIKTERKTITTKREEESITEASCDYCLKQLDLVKEQYYNCEKDSIVIDKYIELTTSHSDWGNDSVDSIECYQFCCVECCLEWIKKNKKELESHTRRFNIECNDTY